MWRYLMFTTFVFLCGLLGFTDSQGNPPTVHDVQNQLSNVLNTSDLGNFNTSGLPTVEEAKDLFKQKCEKNGGPNAYDNAMSAKDRMEECLKSLVNITELEAQMEKYKPTGDLDIVFKNYCRKSPKLKRCVYNFTSAVEPCLEEEEQKNKRVIHNITDSLLNFVCFKEGDRIALFISAGGPECFQSKEQEVQNCVKLNFGSYLPTADNKTGTLSGFEALPSLVFGTKECTDITKLQECVVKELENCPDPTPANIVDSIFKFILRVTPCENLLDSQGRKKSNMQSSAASLVSLLSTTSIVFLLLMLM